MIHGAIIANEVLLKTFSEFSMISSLYFQWFKYTVRVRYRIRKVKIIPSLAASSAGA